MKRDQPAKPDKGGNRGSNHGLGKMGSSHEGFSQSDLAKGHKKLRTVPVKESGKGARAKG